MFFFVLHQTCVVIGSVTRDKSDTNVCVTSGGWGGGVVCRLGKGLLKVDGNLSYSKLPRVNLKIRSGITFF